MTKKAKNESMDVLEIPQFMSVVNTKKRVSKNDKMMKKAKNRILAKRIILGITILLFVATLSLYIGFMYGKLM